VKGCTSLKSTGREKLDPEEGRRRGDVKWTGMTRATSQTGNVERESGVRLFRGRPGRSHLQRAQRERDRQILSLLFAKILVRNLSREGFLGGALELLGAEASAGRIFHANKPKDE